jgi:UDP-glucuronate 4-epimerase
MHVLVTGAAGFIGFHLCRHLAGRGMAVTGLDNLNDYYSVALKQARLSILNELPGFDFHRTDLADSRAVADVFARTRPTHVVHLAAQAGVRYSLENPRAYIDSNLVGFFNILDNCKTHNIAHLVYASSSSVYGLNQEMPFKVEHNVDHPVSLYAATKKADELMAHTYAWLYGLPCTGLRFFTVYGEWGRPDMAYYSFTRDILNNTPIKVFNHGRSRRDFTHVDDVVPAVADLVHLPPTPDPDFDRSAPDPGSSPAPYRVYNIGNNTPVSLEHFISVLEDAVGKKAVKEYLPMQPGDVEATFADISRLQDLTGFRPTTTIEHGLPRFVEWYLGYHDAQA